MRRKTLLPAMLFVALLACGFFMTENTDITFLVQDEMDFKFQSLVFEGVEIDQVAVVEQAVPCLD